MGEKQIDLDAMRALARDLDTFALSIARRGQIQAALLEMSAEIEQLRAFIESETGACSKSHLGGPCGACARRIAFLSKPPVSPP